MRIAWFIWVAIACSCFDVLSMESESYTSRIQDLQRTLERSQENPSTVALRATRPLAAIIPLQDIPEQTPDHHLKALIEIIKLHGWEIVTPRMQDQIAKNGWRDQIISQVGHGPPVKAIEPQRTRGPLIAAAGIALAALAGCDLVRSYFSITPQEWHNEQGWYNKCALVWSGTYLTKFLNRLR